MIRWASIASILCSLIFCTAAFAQDSVGEYSKAMDAYKAHDYHTSCSRLTNFYAASNNFHNLRPELLNAVTESGKSVTGLRMSAMQAENGREPAKACSDYYQLALLLATDDEWSQVEKALLSAEQARQKMIEDMTPEQRKLKPQAERETGPPDSSLAAIVAAAHGANSGESGGCASDPVLHSDAKLNAVCVNHLLTLARKQRSAGQRMMSKLNYERVIQVTGYLGAKQDLAAKREATVAIRAIERAQQRSE